MVLINKLNSGERELMWNVLFHKNLRAEAWESGIISRPFIAVLSFVIPKIDFCK